MKRFYIFGKFHTQKTFRAMDINQGVQVGNRIKATVLDEADKDKFMTVEAPRNTPDWVFEPREIC